MTTAAAGTVILSSATGAHAEPTPTVASVKDQVDKLNNDAEVATEKYDALKAKREQLQASASQMQDRVASGQDKMNQLQTLLGSVASAQYRNGGIDPSVQLMLSANPDTYLQQASAENQVTDTTTGLLKQLQSEQRRMDQDRAEAAATLAELDTSTTALAASKKDIQDKLAQAQALLNKLSAADRAKVNGQDAATTRASRSADRPTYNGPATGRAADAVRFAYAQLGKPYRWGATGPDSFDCSGLTGAAWAAAGVSLPRVSQDQWNAGQHVARADLQPGDLVFFFGDLHHVGMYIGNGQMIHAPRTGENVMILDMSAMDGSYMGAVRP
ncbi:C40 family peptidase [Kitasatospora nipponensis]